MYCVKCGVKLQEGAAACPLCHTPVWNPEEISTAKNYPDRLPRQHSESGLPGAVAMTVFCLIAAAVVMTVCFAQYGALRWGGYAVFGLALFYIIVVLPGWFRRPMGEIFVPADHAAIALYVLYICVRTGGRWYMSFAFPVIGISCILSTAMVCLLKYVKKGKLFIFGGFFILLGGFTVLVELFEHISFGTQMFLWSLYSLIGFGAIGVFLLLSGMIPPLRQALEKRFFF